MHSNINLIRAIIQIDKKHDHKRISMIEMEDGSGMNYNYKVVGEDKWHFHRVEDDAVSITLQVETRTVTRFPESKL